LRAPQCVICSDRLPGAQLLMGDGRCPACHHFAPEFDRAMSFGEYEGGLRELIHLLKYESVVPVASVLGGMAARTLKQLLPSCGGSAPLVVPVPLHRSKRHDRGFNQAELIAHAAAKRLPGRVTLSGNVLVRQRATMSQVGLTREQRVANMRDAFRVCDRQPVRGATVILVDDVMTTGTTLSECARVLKRAGAERVFAVTVARAFQGVSLQAAIQSVQVIHAEEEANEAAVASV
jgi:ComF family protein